MLVEPITQRFFQVLPVGEREFDPILFGALWPIAFSWFAPRRTSGGGGERRGRYSHDGSRRLKLLRTDCIFSGRLDPEDIIG
jgi:hypothetical protein